jgi:hypothetical protein
MRINAKLLACAALYQAEKDVREYLNGVNLSPGKDGTGTTIVATDGHVIFAGFDDDNGFIGDRPFTVVIPKTVITQLKKRSNETAEVVIQPNNRCYLSVGNATYDLKVMYEAFPEWRRIIPSHATKELSEVETAPTCIQPAYMQLIGLTGSILCPGMGAMTIITTGKDNPAVVRYHSKFGQALSIVMPVRSDPFEALTFI